MKHKSFVIFILTHGRASNIKTLKTLRKVGYTGKVVLVIDNEDELEKDYYRIYGKENVYMFDKQDIAERYDQMDNFEERRTIFYARNACFEIARKLGYEYFLELDDDYTSFEYRMIQNKRLVGRPVKTFDEICNIMLDFLDITQVQTQKQKGGMSEQYLDSGTFLKSFYSVMCCPSCVTVNMMGGTKKTMRLHHNVSWNNCTPKIISDKYKK